MAPLKTNTKFMEHPLQINYVVKEVMSKKNSCLVRERVEISSARPKPFVGDSRIIKNTNVAVVGYWESKMAKNELRCD